MPTNLENLKTRRTAIITELAAIDVTKAGGNPNSSLEGGSVDHQGYVQSLVKQVKDLGELITILEPVEVETIGLT